MKKITIKELAKEYNTEPLEIGIALRRKGISTATGEVDDTEEMRETLSSSLVDMDEEEQDV